MSEIINLNMRVMARNGDKLAMFNKQVEMDTAPTVGIKFSEIDVVLKPHDITYDLPTKHYYINFWEYLADSDSSDSWDFLIEHGWSKS